MHRTCRQARACDASPHVTRVQPPAAAATAQRSSTTACRMNCHGGKGTAVKAGYALLPSASPTIGPSSCTCPCLRPCRCRCRSCCRQRDRCTSINAVHLRKLRVLLQLLSPAPRTRPSLQRHSRGSARTATASEPGGLGGRNSCTAAVTHHGAGKALSRHALAGCRCDRRRRRRSSCSYCCCYCCCVLRCCYCASCCWW